MHTTLIRVRTLLLAAFGAIAGAATSQPYPSKPVRLVLGAPPAGGADVIMRPLAQRLSESTGQQFVIDNRPGAGSIIAAQLVLNAPSDGYTLLQGSASGFSISPFIAKKRPYDPALDFTPITLVATAPLLVTVHPVLPVRTMRELIALAKARPKELFYASNGMGSFSHFTTELLSRRAGIAMTHVPYKGGAPAVMDTVSGNVQLVITALPTLLTQVKAGRLRALAVTGPSRSPVVPDLPTVAESALPGFESVQWYAIFAPKATPAKIVDKLHAQIRSAVETDRVRKGFAAEGAEAAVGGPKALEEFHRADVTRWSVVIRESGVVLQ